MVKCPKCAAVLDVEEDEMEEGEILNCPECEVELEVVSLHPAQLNVISGEEHDDEEDEEEDEDEDEEEEDEDDDEEE